MRTFNSWAAVLVVSVLIFVGCNTPTGNNPNPAPSKVSIVSSVDSISGTVGDTVLIQAYAEPDSLQRPVAALSNNAGIAVAVAETVIVLRSEGQTTIRLRWTDGQQEVVKAIPVTVARSPWTTLRVQVVRIESDSAALLDTLWATIAWRVPWKDSVRAPIDASGFASFRVLRETVEAMDSVTTTVAGSRNHINQSHNFLRKEVTFLPSWTKEMMFQATNSDFSSTGGDTYIDAVYATFVVNPEFRFVLVPTEFTPSVGIGAGQAVTISPTALYTSDFQSSKGWMSGIPFTNSNWQNYVDSLPIRVCADESVSGSVADSLAFWGSVNDSLNVRTGKVWFVPATTKCRAYWGVNPSLSGAYGRVSSKNGLPFVELKYFPSDTGEGGRHVVQRTIPHEFIHLLGFGHAGGWTSIMSVDGDKSMSVTDTDNAILHLFYELWLAKKRVGGAVSVEATRQYLAMRGQWPNGWRLDKVAAGTANGSEEHAPSVWHCH